MRHLASAHWDRPACGSIMDTYKAAFYMCPFLSFGRLVCTDQISNCPLDRVLTYKNLIIKFSVFFCSQNDLSKNLISSSFGQALSTSKSSSTNRKTDQHTQEHPGEGNKPALVINSKSSQPTLQQEALQYWDARELLLKNIKSNFRRA